MKTKLLSSIAILLAVATVTIMAMPQAKAQQAQQTQQADDDPVSVENITRDPNIPVLGNAKGDITVVEYFDYRCPYCKRMNPMLQKIVKDDGHIRLIFKDWPIFGDVSIYAARLALATKYQNKYPQAHEALISTTEKLTETKVQVILAQAGIDVAQAQHDLASHGKDIDALLARNHEQAIALQFQGTPAFIIGKYRVPGALDEKNFKLAIADSRKATKGKKE
jgi:protein-disulfide isomerase